MGVLVARTAETGVRWYQEVLGVGLPVRRFGGSPGGARFVARFMARSVEGVEDRHVEGAPS